MEPKTIFIISPVIIKGQCVLLIYNDQDQQWEFPNMKVITEMLLHDNLAYTMNTLFSANFEMILKMPFPHACKSTHNGDIVDICAIHYLVSFTEEPQFRNQYKWHQIAPFTHIENINCNVAPAISFFLQQILRGT